MLQGRKRREQLWRGQALRSTCILRSMRDTPPSLPVLLQRPGVNWLSLRGDGTVREVAAGLFGTLTVLGILPLSSVMNTTRVLHIP